MTELTENLDDLIAGAPLLVLQFGDDACGPCHAIRFKVENWSEEKT